MMLEYIRFGEQEEKRIPPISRGGPNLDYGEMRFYAATRDLVGNITGYVEAKRGVDEMEDTIVLDPEQLWQKKQKHRHYPGVGTRARPERLIIEDSSDEGEEEIPVTLDHNTGDDGNDPVI